MTFRIATFNLHQGFKRWQERRELIVEQLGALRPDVLALNEISVPLQSGRWLWQAAKERLGLQYAFAQQTKSSGWSLDEAQGLLTRFPVVETGNLDYLARGRVAQVVRIEIEGQQVDVYVTHLHHVPEEDGLRQYQVQRLFQWIDSRDDAVASAPLWIANCCTRSLMAAVRARILSTALPSSSTTWVVSPVMGS